MKSLMGFISLLVMALLVSGVFSAAQEKIKVTLEWKSGKLMKWENEAWGLAAYDVDGDGVKDLIVPLTGNNISVISGVTHREILRFQIDNNSLLSFLFNYIFVAQMDGDSDEELVLGAMGLLLGTIYVVDLKTHQVEMRLSTPGGTLDVDDVNGDGTDEILIATNHVEIYRVGLQTPVHKSVNMSGYAHAMTVAEIDAKPVVFVASERVDMNLNYHTRIYGFTLPDLKMFLNISVGNKDVHTIEIADINGDGKKEIIIGTDRLIAYSLNGDVVWQTGSISIQVNNVKVADLLGNGINYLIVASENIEIWDITTREIVWQSEELYDAGEYGGLLITKLSPHGTTKIITWTYAYYEGGRIYQYGVSLPEISNASANTTGTKNLRSSDQALLYGVMGIAAAVIATTAVLILLRIRKNKETGE